MHVIIKISLMKSGIINILCCIISNFHHLYLHKMQAHEYIPLAIKLNDYNLRLKYFL